MLSCPLMSYPLPSPPKPYSSRPIRGLPIWKNLILIRKFEPKGKFGGRIWRSGVSEKKNMTEMVRFDAISQTDDDAEVGEEEVVPDPNPSNGSLLEVQGFQTTMNRMSKWLVTASFVAFILWRHDAEALWAAMGSVINSSFSIILKRILNQQRPTSALRSDPGMPSSHSQSMFYLAFYIVLSLFDGLGMNIFTIVTGAITFIGCSYLSWLRVSQKYHTIDQVLVGATLGSTCGVAWFWMWHSLVQAAFIASIWVKIVVILMSVAFSAAFLLYVMRHWVGLYNE